MLLFWAGAAHLGQHQELPGLYINTSGLAMGRGGTEKVGLQVPKVGELWGGT